MSARPEISIAIERSPQEVFDYVLDLEQTPQWRPRMSKVGWIDDGPPGLGSRFRVTSTVLRIPFRFRMEIIVFDPPRSLRYLGRLGSSDMEGIWECLPDDMGCRFFLGADYRVNSRIMKAFLPLIGAAVLWHDYHDLVRLKTILEGRTGDQ